MSKTVIERPMRYTKPYYPPGYGFWTSNVIVVENQLMDLSRPVSKLADEYFDVTHIVSTVNDMMENFKTTEEILRNIETNDEISLNSSYGRFWIEIGCRLDTNEVDRFRSELASAMVNTIVNGMTYRLRLTPDEETEKRMKAFVAIVNSCFTIKWM